MIVSRRRKCRHLSVGLIILVLVGMLTLLSHLWTAAPDGRKNPLQHDDRISKAVPLHNDILPAVPTHNNKNEVTLEDNRKYVIPLEENKSSTDSSDESKTAVPPDNNQLDAVPKDDNQRDEVPRNGIERRFTLQIPQHGQASFHDVFNATSLSMANLRPNDQPINLVQLGNPGENTGRKRIPEIGPGPPSSAEEFLGKREDEGSDPQPFFPTLLQNKTGEGDSSAGVGSFQSPVDAAPSEDVKNTNLVFGFPRNDMNRNDFAADAEENEDFPLPMKSTSSETNVSVWEADPNSTEEFDPGLKFTRQNSSNFPTSVDNTDGGLRVVSMSLYGVELRYSVGAIRNAELVKENFPGWTLRIYMESPASSTPRFGLVPRNIVEKLRSLGVDIHYIVPEQDFIPPMMWRFLVADDLSVDYFIIRDSDSRLTTRDAEAVSAWIGSGKPFHSIRDHPSHASYAVSGGLWGGRTKELRDILRRSWIDLMRGASSQYLEDMNFLNNVIWPRVQFHAYCSDSVSCDRWPNSHPFPVARYGYDHVGQVFNEHDLGRPVDIRILRAAGENPRCTTSNGS